MRERNRINQVRYRARRKEREAATQQAVEGMRKQLQELVAHNAELGNRERLMSQLVQAQEQHIDLLADHEVYLSLPCSCLQLLVWTG